ncbi:MAG: MFS transporter [Bacteroidetes bacterium]|nr:MFS transporter [Bacteroidota bacterium]MBL6944907.1 MFS transporter [Bacteroidales bacterium]
MKKPVFKSAKVFTVSSAHFVHDVYSSFLAPLLPLLIEKFALSLASASVLSIVQQLPSFLSLFVGAVAHKLPWRWIIILAPLITGICGSLIGLAPDQIVLGVLLFTIGISSALFHVPAPVMIKYFSGNQAGKGMSLYMLGGEAARMIGPVLIVTAVSIWQLEGTWRLIFPVVAASVTLFFVLENKPYQKYANNGHKPINWWSTIKEYKYFFFALTVFMLFRSLMKGSLATFLPTYMGMKGSSLFTGAIALSVLQLSAAFGSFIMGGISDRIGRFKSLLILSILSPIFMLIFVFSGFTLQMVLLLVLGVVLYATSPVMLALVLEQGSNQPAMMNTGFTTINFATNAIAVLFTGIIGDIIGLDMTLQIAAFLGIAAVPAVFILKKYSKEKR